MLWTKNFNSMLFLQYDVRQSLKIQVLEIKQNKNKDFVRQRTKNIKNFMVF